MQQPAIRQRWVITRNHTGQVTVSDANAAYNSQQWPGMAAGAVIGAILAKTILAAHPVAWGVGILIGGGVYTMSHLFECNSMQTDPATMTACERQGFVEVMPLGAAAALILLGLL